MSSPAILIDVRQKALWLVPHDDDRIEMLKLRDDGTYGKPDLFVPGEILTSPLLPGFELDVAALFAGLS